ncbi:WecB/TagA/CpsF family glycosyltransferase [Glycomyces sp. NPDC046736]|uniref:WecB/TagA/CpsF family glycosyltransferase n=1 Tax=Glycomyces sp. NPDC046736 TaxID=3155615 RepID=UPI0033DD5E3B
MAASDKRSVLGTQVDATTYAAAVDEIAAAARDGRPMAVTALAVHGVIESHRQEWLRAELNDFDLVAPDGQPVRWALNLLHKAGLSDRVYGPLLTIKVLERMAAEGLPVYFYGSTAETLEALQKQLAEQIPELRIAGAEASQFRLSEDDDAHLIAERVKASGARVLFVGLGCPRQEQFVYQMRPHLDMPQLAVGAAFDYHAGNLRIPPPWMQRAGLEWLWRLGLEPKRLWRRYVLLNPLYVSLLAAQWLRLWRPGPAKPGPEPRRFPV